MIKQFHVSKALFDHLKSISGLPPIAGDNSSFKPIIGQPYMREADLSGMTQAPTLNADGFQRIDGLYRIGVFYPKATGRFNALANIDTLGEAFKRGTVLTSGDQSVRIERCDRDQGLIDGEWYQVGLMIRYTVIN